MSSAVATCKTSFSAIVIRRENSARYWLASGMNEVVVVFSDRDLSTRPYGLGDRYGQQLPNKRCLRKVQIKDGAG